MNLLPAYIEGEDGAEGLVQGIRLPREYGVNFKTGQLTGKIVEGKEAIKVWIWFAMQTPRYRYYIYTWDYGNEFEDLIGQGYTGEYIEAEARRMTEDCLAANEDIQNVTEFSVHMEDGVLMISFTVNTIYGDIEFKDEVIARPEVPGKGVYNAV